MTDTRLKIGTLNIQKRNRSPLKAARIEDAILEHDWDVLFLQECLLSESGQIFGLERLQEHLSFQAISISRRIRKDVWMGNGILSKFPLTHLKTLSFQHAAGVSKRSALIASVDIEGDKYLLVALHLGLMESERTLQLSTILEYCKSNAHDYSGLLIAGDFNDWSGQCHRRISLWASEQETWSADESHILSHQLPATYPAIFPVLALDRIYAWGNCRIETLRSLGTPLISDHRALVADIFFRTSLR